MDAALVSLLVGLAAGGLVGRIARGGPPGGRVGAMEAGGLGGLGGGWALDRLSVDHGLSWVGALAPAAATGAVALLAALRALARRRSG